MPKIPFNFNRITPELPNAPQRQESLAPYQINQQALATQERGRKALSSGITNAVSAGMSARDKYIKDEDESDMIAARAAYLRMRKAEDQAIASTSNPAEVKKISEDYDRKYNEIMSGNDPAFDRPYFRNQSGKDAFTKHFTEGFNLKRGLSASDTIFSLNRRNSHANIMNGIKSIPDSDYYDQPQAEDETSEYVQKLVEGGHLTEAEGADKNRIALVNLDLERSGRKLSELSPEPMLDFDGSGAKNPLPNQVDQYKEYVDSLSHLDEGQKKQFKAKADSILKTSIAATKAATKERDDQIKRDQYTKENGLLLKIATGEKPLSHAVVEPGISPEFRRGLIKNLGADLEKKREAFKAKTKTPEQLEIIRIDKITANRVTGQALKFDVNTDPTFEKRAALIQQISESAVIAKPLQTILINQLTEGRKLSPEEESVRSTYIDEIDRVYGLTPESFKAYDYNPWGPTGKRSRTDVATGQKFVDELSEYKRQLKVTKAIAQYDYLNRQGQPKEAKEYMEDFIKASATDLNTVKLNSNYYKKKYK